MAILEPLFAEPETMIAAYERQAAQKNRLAKRLVRRQVTRRLGRSYNKLWR